MNNLAKQGLAKLNAMFQSGNPSPDLRPELIQRFMTEIQSMGCKNEVNLQNVKQTLGLTGNGYDESIKWLLHRHKEGGDKMEDTAVRKRKVERSESPPPASKIQKKVAQTATSSAKIQPTPHDLAVNLILRSLSSAKTSGDQGMEWRSELCHALGISPSAQVLAQLSPVRAHLEALAPSMSSTELKEIIAHLPTALAPLQTSKTSSLQIKPPKHDATVALDGKVKAAKEGDLQERVKALTELCHAHVECLQWWKGQHAQLTQHKGYIDQNINEVATDHMKLIQQLSLQRKNFLGLRKKLESEKNTLDQQVLQRTLTRDGAEKKLDFTSCLDMLQSKDPAVVEALSKREDLRSQIATRTRSIQQNERKETYIKTLRKLLDKIKSQLRSDQEEHERRFAASRSSLDSGNQRGLANTIPVLLQHLQEFVAFNGERRSKAQKKLSEREAELAEHVRLYMNDAPSERKDLELKVREMKGIVERSQQTLYSCGKSQADFWNKCFDDLPEEVRNVLVKQLLASRAVWLSNPNSPMKGLIEKCELIESDRLARAAAAAAEKAARERATAEATRAKAQAEIDAKARLRAEAEAEVRRRMQQVGNGAGGSQQAQQVQQARASTTGTTPTARTSTTATTTAAAAAAATKPPPPVRPVSLLPVGTRVFTRFLVGTNRMWYEGHITHSHANDTYDVEYADGDTVRSVGRSKLHLILPSDTTEPVHRLSAGKPDASMDDSDSNSGGCAIS